MNLKVSKWVFSILVLFLIVLLNNQTVLAGEYERIGGKDRFEVAVNLSKKTWPQSAEKVVLAYYNAYADALSAAPLAYHYDAPILLTQKKQLTNTTKIEIQRLKPKEVIIVGGPGSVSPNIEAELKGMSVNVRRIGGIDRFEVASEVAKELPANSSAVIAYGLNFPDALAIAPYASRNGMPILLTNKDHLPTKTIESLQTRSITKTIVVGGEGSVGPSVFSNLPSPTRIGGRDRFEVAVNIIRTLGIHSEKAYVATGLTFADALTGSVVAAKEKAPILLTGKTMPDQTRNVVREKNINTFTVLGGTGSVEEPVVKQLFKKYDSAPIVYFVPHADDEILTYGVNIRNEVRNGRKVFLVLLSEGEDSIAREVINGRYDRESIQSNLAGKKVYCRWHKKYHDAYEENYLHGHLTEAAFGDLRQEDYFKASIALGVPREHLEASTIPTGQFTFNRVKAIMVSYINRFPNAEFRTMSKYDSHAGHALLGKALEQLEAENMISDLQTRYYISIYTDRFANKQFREKVYVEKLKDATDSKFINDSIKVYSDFHPKEGRYATGYHSVPQQFDSLSKSFYTKYYY